MHSAATVERVLELKRAGLNNFGLRWTAAFPKSESAAVSIYVSRKADVARLDKLVGPKR
jgi:hypothetical protein